MEKICILCGSKYSKWVANNNETKSVEDKQKVVQAPVQIDYGFIHQL